MVGVIARPRRYARLSALPLAVFALAAAPRLVWAAPQSQKPSGPQAVLEAGNPSTGLPDLPPAPSARQSTIFGGAIRNIDPVRDQFSLHIYGQRPMTVLFDERTQVYRDGVRIPVHDLKPADHASVQTALDGSGIFAISIHILSSIPKGEYVGRVLRFNDASGELQLDAFPSPRPFKVFVAPDASIVRKGQTAFTAEGSGRFDLRPGSLVQVTFSPGVGPMAMATHIVVLAVPGSSFIFTGSITNLDTAGGSLVLVDPSDQKSYQISFDPEAIAGSQNLRIGQRVRITAEYDGSAYRATSITAY